MKLVSRNCLFGWKSKKVKESRRNLSFYEWNLKGHVGFVCLCSGEGGGGGVGGRWRGLGLEQKSAILRFAREAQENFIFPL